MALPRDPNEFQFVGFPVSNGFEIGAVVDFGFALALKEVYNDVTFWVQYKPIFLSHKHLNV
jgi:hypothetical protein